MVTKRNFIFSTCEKVEDMLIPLDNCDCQTRNDLKPALDLAKKDCLTFWQKIN